MRGAMPRRMRSMTSSSGTCISHATTATGRCMWSTWVAGRRIRPMRCSTTGACCRCGNSKRRSRCRQKTEHDETVSRLAAAYQGRRGGAGRPHRDRHEGDLRTSDALRPGEGLSAADHQTGLSQGGDPRTVVVPARRYEYPLSGRTGGSHLGQRRIPLL